MVKKTIGILVSIAVIAVIVLAIMQRTGTGSRFDEVVMDETVPEQPDVTEVASPAPPVITVDSLIPEAW